MDLDPLRIVVRVVVAYVVILALIRVTGKTTVKHATPFDFVVALVTGDLVDDAIWAEVELGVFLAAAGALFLVHVGCDIARYRAGLAR
jgi:uncharacterized membrane protein YcaP (DUF421 family)